MRSAPKVELKTDEEPVSCDVCGRTILKGERVEPFLAPGGKRKNVCELCIPRADHEGWIRESAQDALLASRQRPQQRRSFVGRLRGMLGTPDEADGAPGIDSEPAPAPMLDEQDQPPPAPREPAPPPPPPPPAPRREGRQIRAVPTTAQAKVDRALEVFNSSDHPRTIAGIARTLGPPWVHASPDGNAPSEVTVVVAWELSWYHYKIDLGDADEPISLLEKGDELSELEEPLREWNGLADENGRLTAR